MGNPAIDDTSACESPLASQSQTPRPDSHVFGFAFLIQPFCPVLSLITKFSVRQCAAATGMPRKHLV